MPSEGAETGGIDRAPGTIPLAALAEPTEAPPPWDTSGWPSAPPQWHSGAPVSSAWGDEERNDVEYLDPLTPRPRFRIPQRLLWCVGVLVLVFLGRTLLFHGDWADGVMMVSVAAGILVVIAFVTASLGSLVTWRLRVGTFALAVGLLVFAILCAADGTQTRVHLAQAAFAEHTGQWSQANQEYAISHAQPGWTARQQVRVDLAWAEDALQRGNYATAVAHFQAVVNAATATKAQQAAARAGEATAYERWIATDDTDVPYVLALTNLLQYASDPACKTTCQIAVTAADAQAYYAYGTQLQRQGDIADAVGMFQTVTERFPKSPFAAKAHQAAATALSTQAQQTQQQSCLGAVPYLQQLASGYADTAEGKQAQQSLAAPVVVHGTIRNLPNPSGATVYLVPRDQWVQGNWTPAYTTSADLIGDFTFLDVTPGVYVLEVGEPGGGFVAWSNPNSYVQVSPLCQLALAPYTY